VLRVRGDRALRLFFGYGASGGLLRGEEAASDELLLVCAGEEGRVGTAGVLAAGRGPREAWEVDEEEIFRLQDRTALISLVRNRTLTLIEREEDSRS
jgi:hypothetical protein